MRQVVARVARVERKLEDLHAGKTGIGEQLHDLGRGIAEVLGDEIEVAEPAGQHADERHAGALDPAAVFGGRLAVGNGPVALEAAEMVDADDIVELLRAADAADPPAEAVLRHGLVVVERVAPELPVLAEAVRRDAGDLGGHVVLVELEHFGFCPHVGGVHRHIDGQVADDADAERVDVRLECLPLAEEEKLNVSEKLHILAQLGAVALDDLAACAAADVLVVPFRPRLHAEVALERHEEGVVRQPALIFPLKCRDGLAVARKAARLGLFEQREAARVDFAVVDIAGIVAPVAGVDLRARQELIFDEQVQVDEIRVTRKGRKALIRRVAVARRAERQELPVFLPRGGEKVGKVIGGLAHRADAVGRGKGRDRHQNAGGTFDQWNHFFLENEG